MCNWKKGRTKKTIHRFPRWKKKILQLWEKTGFLFPHWGSTRTLL
jgi:hypothetical protein